jgi:porin
LGAPGLSFTVGASYSSGRNLSAKHIGNAFTVQSAFDGTGNVNLQLLYLQQELLDRALTIALGRLAPANTFATLPVFNNYMNGGINSYPGSLNINDSTFTASPPGVEWGAQALYNVTPTVLVAAGVYNTNLRAAAGNDNGINFAFQQGNTGVLTVTQVSYLYNQAQGDVGMPGEYTFGGSYDNNTFRSLSSSVGAELGSYSLYALFQQMVFRDGEPGSLKGLTVWGEAALSPKPSVSTMPYFLGGGLSYQGIIPSRENDIASLGLIYGSFSGYIPQTSGETAIEANYRIAFTPWLSIMPDVQYIVKPGGSSNIQNAVVLGAQLEVTF